MLAPMQSVGGFRLKGGSAIEVPVSQSDLGQFPHRHRDIAHDRWFCPRRPLCARSAAAVAALDRVREIQLHRRSQRSDADSGGRDLVGAKGAGRAGIKGAADDVLITSGSGQGLDLVHRLLVEPGDTVLVEEFSYQGTISKLRRLRADIVPVPLDEKGMRIDALANILEDLGRNGIVPKLIYTK